MTDSIFLVILQNTFLALPQCGTATANINAAISGSGICSCAVAVSLHGCQHKNR